VTDAASAEWLEVDGTPAHLWPSDNCCASRDAKSVSVAREVEGVLRRDAKSVSVARVAKSVSVASAESASVAHEVEGVLHRDAKSVSEGVLLRDAKSVSVARDAESASGAHVVEGVLRHDAKSVSVAHEVEGVSRAEPHTTRHEAEGDAPSVDSTRVPTVAIEIDATSMQGAQHVETDATSVHVVTDALLQCKRLGVRRYSFRKPPNEFKSGPESIRFSPAVGDLGSATASSSGLARACARLHSLCEVCGIGSEGFVAAKIAMALDEQWCEEDFNSWFAEKLFDFESREQWLQVEALMRLLWAHDSDHLEGTLVSECLKLTQG
jgi:hypothetical protein